MDAGGNQSSNNDAATQSILDKVAMVATILLAIIVIVAIWVIIF
jgi:flagellar biosynthesis/type III secretory pathway M-ring protein FliF/YscJ